MLLSHLLQRRQLIERGKTEIVKKMLGGCQQCRTARYVTVTDHVHPPAILQHLDRLRVDRDATNLLDVATGHGLAVSNDGQRLKRGTRVFGRLFRVQPVKKDLHLGAALETPARREAHQLDATLCPLLLQLIEDSADRVAVERRLLLLARASEQFFQVIDRHRLVGTQQCRLEDFLRLSCIHLRFV